MIYLHRKLYRSSRVVPVSTSRTAFYRPAAKRNRKRTIVEPVTLQFTLHKVRSIWRFPTSGNTRPINIVCRWPGSSGKRKSTKESSNILILGFSTHRHASIILVSEYLVRRKLFRRSIPDTITTYICELQCTANPSMLFLQEKKPLKMTHLP